MFYQSKDSAKKEVNYVTETGDLIDLCRKKKV